MATKSFDDYVNGKKKEEKKAVDFNSYVADHANDIIKPQSAPGATQTAKKARGIDFNEIVRHGAGKAIREAQETTRRDHVGSGRSLADLPAASPVTPPIKLSADNKLSAEAFEEAQNRFGGQTLVSGVNPASHSVRVPDIPLNRDLYRRAVIEPRKAEMQKSIDDAIALATEHPALGGMLSVASGIPGSAMTLAETARAKLAGEETDINKPMYRLQRQSTAFREGMTQGIRDRVGAEDDSFASKAVDFGVGTGLSIVETLIRSTLLTPAGGAVQAGLSAGAQEFIRQKENGADDLHAIATGVAYGVAEDVFEKFSLEGLAAFRDRPVDSIKQAVLNILRQAFTEGSEEFATDWANAVSDYVINRDDSEWTNGYNRYIQEGKDDIGAKWNVVMDTLTDATVSFLGGAISGGLLGGGAQLMNYRTNTRSGEQLMEEGQGFTRDELKEAAESIKDSPEEYGGANAREALQQARDTKELLSRLSKKETLTPTEQGAALTEIEKTVRAASSAPGVTARASVFPEEAEKIYKDNAKGIKDIVPYDRYMRQAYEAGLNRESLGEALNDEGFAEFYNSNKDAVDAMHREGFKTRSQQIEEGAAEFGETAGKIYRDNFDGGSITEYNKNMGMAFIAGYEGRSLDSVESDSFQAYRAENPKAIERMYEAAKEAKNGREDIPGEGRLQMAQRPGEQTGGVSQEARRVEEVGQAVHYRDRQAKSLRITGEIEARRAVRTAAKGQKFYTFEGDTEETSAARNMADAAGYEYDLYAADDGGFVVGRRGATETARGYTDTSTGRIGAVVNNQDVTARQIIGHEIVEIANADGRVDLDGIYERARSDSPVLAEAIDLLAEKYLEWSTDTDIADARKEMFCDVGGEINQFEGDAELSGLMDYVTARVRPMLNKALDGALTSGAKARPATRARATVEEASGGRVEHSTKLNRNEAERSRALRKGEMVNRFRKEVNWQEYYDRLDNDPRYSSDRYDDGDVAYMRMDNGDRLRLVMQENGEFAVTAIERKDKDGQVRRITAPDYGGERVSRADSRHGDNNNRTESESKERHAGDSEERQEREGSNQSRSAVHPGEGRTGSASREVKELKDAGIAVDTEAGVAHYDYSTKLSWKTPEQINKAVDALMKTLGVDEDSARQYVNSELSLTNLILSPGNVAAMDFEADDRYSAIKKNSDYPQGTIDFNNNCKKRVPFTTLYERLQRSNPNRVFTAEDLEIIRQEMIANGYPVACAFCYVEERRQRLGEIAEGFATAYNNGALLDAFEGKKEYDKIKAALDKAAGDDYKPTIYDLITYDGLRVLDREHPGIAEAFKIYNNARGMQSGRLVEGRAEYKRELLSYTPAMVKRINDMGGLRIFSYSDFEAINLLDLVQVIQDASVVGLKIQAYTKVPAFARAIRNTRIKLNRSLIPAGTGIKYVNGKPELDLDTFEGIDVNDPDFFDSTDDADVGNIIIGMSDEQIRLAMESPLVDYIIPFHTNLSMEIRKKKHIDHWKNYKLFQTDRNKATGKNATDINIYTEVLDAARAEGKPIRNRKEFQEKFFEVAKKKNLIPRFAQFIKKDVHGNYLYTPGYEKFLLDFKLFDKNGNIVEQRPVVPVFDDEYNTKLMNDFANGVGYTKISDKLYNDVVNRLNDESAGDTVKLSTGLRPVEQKISSAKTSLNQVPALFKDSRAVFGKTNIDIGGGKYDAATNFLSERGTRSMVFDPYNRGEESNTATLDYLRSGKKADTATCANVLNVIAEQDARDNVILETAKAIKPGGTAYFMVYEGDHSGTGKETSAGWQNNRITASYVPEIEKYFNDVERKGKLIIAKDPRADLPKASWEVKPGNAIEYSTRLKRDTDYLNAVKKNDMKTAERLVREAAADAGYTVEGYHGTQRFGFTRTDTSKSDDKLSFFVTSAVDTASSYSDSDEVREVSRGEMSNEERAEYEENARHLASDALLDFTEKLNREVGVRDWADRGYLERTCEEAAKNDFFNVEYNSAVYEELETAAFEAYQEINPLEDVEDLFAQETNWQEFEKWIEESGVMDAIITAEERYIAYGRALNNELNIGNYHLFIDPSNLLVIDGQGKNWNDLTYEPMKGFRGMNGRHLTTRIISYYASENGYNGVLFKNIVDNGGRSGKAVKAADVYALFYPQHQVKSADTVTYDNDGNVIPLSKRFDTWNDDIRYSTRLNSNGEELSSGQQEYFKDSKIRDDSGRLLVMYHGTENDFTVFDPRKLGGKNGTAEGFGIYLADRKDVSAHYGGRVIEAYANVTKPATSYEKKLKKSELVKLIKATCEAEANRMVDSGDYSNVRDALKDTWVSNYTYTYEKPMAANYDDVASQILRMNDNDMDIVQEVMAGMAIRNYESAYVFYEILKETTGIDGFVTNWTNSENKGDPAKIVVAFDSNQIKNVDNLNPTESDDINYSTRLNGIKPDSAEAEKIYQSLLEKYGAIPPGETPAREIPVPAKTSEEKNVQRFTRTVLESGITNAEMDNAIKGAVVNEMLSYVPISDLSAQKYADSVIKNDGIDGAQKQWDAIVNGNHVVGKNDVALGEKLLMHYAQTGNAQMVLKMTAELATEGRRAGQAIQALSMLKKMAQGAGNSAIVSAAEIHAIEVAINHMNREYRLRFKGKKNIPQIKLNKGLKEQYLNTTDAKAKEEILGMIYKDLGSQVPSTFVDKWNAWRYLAMLGNPRTHIRNIVGNAIFVPAVSLKNTIGAGIEAAVIGNNGERTKSITTTKDNVDYARADYEAVQDLLQGREKADVRDKIMDEREIFGNKVLDTLYKKNGWLLEYEDGIFLRNHYVNAMSHYMSANNLTPSTITKEQLQKARAYAIKEAQKATYRDANALADGINKFSRTNKASRLLVEGILPFKKTPLNILRRGIEYSPIGLLKTLSKGTMDLNNDNITVNEYIDGLASGLSGTLITMLGALLYNLGIVNGAFGDDDKDEKKLQGEQEYSVRVGNKSYTIDWAAPVSMPFFIGVELAAQMMAEHNLSLKDYAEAMEKIAEPMMNLSMLDGLNNTLKAASYEESAITPVAAAVVESYFGQAVPTIFGQAARTIDPYRRVNFVDKNKEIPDDALYFIEKMQNKLPFMSFTNNPYVDAWGDEDVTENLLLRAFENFVSPGYISTVKDDRVTRELSRVGRETDKKLVPKSAPKYIGQKDKRIDLTSDQYYQYQQIVGRTEYALMTDIMDDVRYDSLTADEQAEIFGLVYDYGKAVGKDALKLSLNGAEAYRMDGWMEQAYEANAKYNIPIKDIVYMKAHLSEISGDKDKNGKTINGSKKKNVVKYIDTFNLTKRQKEQMLTIADSSYNMKDVVFHNGSHR